MGFPITGKDHGVDHVTQSRYGTPSLVHHVTHSGKLHRAGVDHVTPSRWAAQVRLHVTGLSPIYVLTRGWVSADQYKISSDLPEVITYFQTFSNDK